MAGRLRPKIFRIKKRGFRRVFYIRFVVEMDFTGRIGVSSPIVSVCVYGFW